MLNTEHLRQMAAAPAYGSDRNKLYEAANEIDTLRLVVSRLNQRCEAVAKVTNDPEVYDLLNDAAWKVEQEIKEEARDG